MNELAGVFKALGDETRLTMLASLLKHRELCVCDFEGALSITQSKASRHLQTLKRAGFLSDRREGLWVYYRIAKDLDPDHKTILAALRKVWCGARVEDVYRQVDLWLERKAAAGLPLCAKSRQGRASR